MYCESRHEAHQGRMFANMALVVARLRRSLRARPQQSIQQLKVPPSHVHTVTPSPKSQTVDFMYYIRETQLVYWKHNCTVLVLARPLQQRIPDLLVLTTYRKTTPGPGKKYKILAAKSAIRYFGLRSIFLAAWDYSKCSTPSPPSPTNKSSKLTFP